MRDQSQGQAMLEVVVAIGLCGGGEWKNFQLEEEALQLCDLRSRT